jgi:CubicO group peptidase (beta-lactamase class C family)
MNVTERTPIEGYCDPGFAAVGEAFAGNFARHGEPGAAVAVCLHGRPVVDLWGGWSDLADTRPWARETLVNVFSVGKAFTAVCLLQLCERGILNLDIPLSRIWPEFAANGKDAITLRHVISHRSGLPALRDPLPDGAMLDWGVMTNALARERPWWEPDTAHGYHVNTFGYLLGEVARRATGKSVGTLLQEHVAGPLGADVFIGLPECEHPRVAEFRWPSGALKGPSDFVESDETALMRWNAYWNPPGLSGAGWVNRREWRLAEIPSTNAHATARGVARVYAALAGGGAVNAVHILSDETLRAAATEHSYGTDLVLDRPARFGLGFQLTHPERLMGPNPRAFGHFGAGGSLGFCDPDSGMAFGYVTCDMGPRWQNPRNQALIDAVYACL